jgi:hypothetical protein
VPTFNIRNIQAWYPVCYCISCSSILLHSITLAGSHACIHPTAYQTYIRLPVPAAGPVSLSHQEKKKREDEQTGGRQLEEVKKKKKNRGR